MVETPVTWSPEQYLAFEAERGRPLRDLLAQLPVIDAHTVVDLGCGPGNSTAALAARFPNAAVRGFDNSAEMIMAARARLPRVVFDVVDINGWITRTTPASVDVLLANAVLHWVPDHAGVCRALAGALTAGGALAVQMPDNFDEPAHRLMREVAAAGRWALKIAASMTPRAAIAGAGWYYDVLHSTGCKTDVWRTTYHHVLPGGTAAVVEWFKGSGLLPFLAPLDAQERGEFLATYEAALTKVYPAMADGSVLLPFPRLFFVAVR